MKLIWIWKDLKGLVLGWQPRIFTLEEKWTIVLGILELGDLDCVDLLPVWSISDFYHAQFVSESSNFDCTHKGDWVIQLWLYTKRSSGDIRGRASDKGFGGGGNLDIVDIVVSNGTCKGSTSKHWPYHQEIASINPWWSSTIYDQESREH